jgi:low temperature requirement protein LtrA
VEESDKRVAPLELFFDLVFVFALTQVTQLMSDKPTWEGLGEGALVLLALTRWLHIFIWAEANEAVDTGQAIVRLARTALPAPLLVIGAGLVDDGTARAVIWIVALSIDLAGPFVFGLRGLRVAAGHFAERFSLVVIIALGESIVAIGAGVEGALDAGVIVAALFGVALACSLWWAYFDDVALVVESRFRETVGHSRVLIARDAYSYLHIPMIAGIILVALGVKKTIGDVDHPLEDATSAALFGGVALYYAGHVGFRLRTIGTVNPQRTLAVVVCVALIPIGTQVDALAALAMATAVSAAVIAYEAISFAETRHRVRGELH